MKMNGAQILLHALKNQGVEKIFGYPGGAIMPTYDALHDFSSEIQHILVRHEQGAVHAAEGYARLKGRAGVCLATSGPGATNLITGIADAMLDSVPLVCITGQIDSNFLGTDAFQEADIIGMTIPVTKWNYQITHADEIPTIVAKAFDIAQSGRPGPVLLDFTKDAQFEEIDYIPAPHVPQQAALTFDATHITQAAALINEAKKPYLLVGHGVIISKAQKVLQEFAEKAGIPVACTLLGLSAFSTGHPLYVGMLGMHGNYGPNVLTNEADLIIAVGMRFDDRVTGDLSCYARQAKVIHIDIDLAEINKNVSTTLALVADAKCALQALLPLIKVNQHEQWLAQFNDCYRQEYEKVIAKEAYPTSGEIKMAEVIHVLSDKTEGQAILVTDVGQHQMIAARYYDFKTSNAHITSGGLGTMGFALPAAIGAQLAEPDRLVVVVAGDGGFQMNIQELGVIAQENLPIKILVLNNSFLGMVRQWQELFFEKRYSFTELQNPDFEKIAQAYGICAECVSEREHLRSAMDRFLASPSSYLLEVRVEQQENVFPMVPSKAGISQIRLN